MRLSYPNNVKIIQVPCTGRVDIIHLLRAIEDGADGVYVAGCLEGECHFINGNIKTRKKVADEYQQRPDREANILAPVEHQCDWLRQIGFEDVDCYFKVFELAVFGGRRP